MPPVWRNFCRNARASPSPSTFGNTLCRIWNGSIFSAAPIEAKSVTVGAERAWRIRCALLSNESMASIT